MHMWTCLASIPAYVCVQCQGFAILCVYICCIGILCTCVCSTHAGMHQRKCAQYCDIHCRSCYNMYVYPCCCIIKYVCSIGAHTWVSLLYGHSTVSMYICLCFTYLHVQHVCVLYSCVCVLVLHISMCSARATWRIQCLVWHACVYLSMYCTWC